MPRHGLDFCVSASLKSQCNLLSSTYISPLDVTMSNFSSHYPHQDLQQPTSIIGLTAEVPVLCPALLPQSMQSLITSVTCVEFAQDVQTNSGVERAK